MQPGFIVLAVLSLAAIVLPVLSARAWWFAWGAAAAIGCWVAGIWICNETVSGWDGLLCGIMGFFGAYAVAGSLVFGLFRVVRSANGTRPVGLETLLGAAVVIDGLAVLAIVLTIRYF